MNHQEEDEATWVQIEVTDVTGPDDFVVVTIADTREILDGRQQKSHWVVHQPLEHPYLRAVEQVRVDELVQAVRGSCHKHEGEETSGVLYQFRLDFPRCRVTWNGELQDSADAFWARVHQSLPPHVARNVLVLCTQGALADVYCAVLRYLVRDPDTHVVDAGHYEIAVDPRMGGDDDKFSGAAMRVSKRFQLVRIEESVRNLAEVRVCLQLELSATLSSGNQIIEAFDAESS